MFNLPTKIVAACAGLITAGGVGTPLWIAQADVRAATLMMGAPPVDGRSV
jgi:hypothetical protein